MNEEILYEGVEYDELGIKHDIKITKNQDGFHWQRTMSFEFWAIPMDIKFNDEQSSNRL